MGELAEAQLDDLPEIEPLDGEYCRVNLKALRGGLSPEILCRLFILSARPRPDGRVRLEAALAEAVSPCGGGTSALFGGGFAGGDPALEGRRL